MEKIYFKCRHNDSQTIIINRDSMQTVTEVILPSIIEVFKAMSSSQLPMSIKFDLSGKFKLAVSPRDFETAFQNSEMCAALRQALEMDAVWSQILNCIVP